MSNVLCNILTGVITDILIHVISAMYTWNRGDWTTMKQDMIESSKHTIIKTEDQL